VVFCNYRKKFFLNVCKWQTYRYTNYWLSKNSLILFYFTIYLAYQKPTPFWDGLPYWIKMLIFATLLSTWKHFSLVHRKDFHEHYLILSTLSQAQYENKCVLWLLLLLLLLVTVEQKHIQHRIENCHIPGSIPDTADTIISSSTKYNKKCTVQCTPINL
jgi:hypothetical protein